jgi:hypothetical protein
MLLQCSAPAVQTCRPLLAVRASLQQSRTCHRAVGAPRARPSDQQPAAFRQPVPHERRHPTVAAAAGDALQPSAAAQGNFWPCVFTLMKVIIGAGEGAAAAQAASAVAPGICVNSVQIQWAQLASIHHGAHTSGS